MNCEDRKDLLFDYALGELDPSVQSELRAHLDSGCETCLQELVETSAAWASLAVDLEPVAVSPEVTERLLTKIRSTTNAGEQPKSENSLLTKPVEFETSNVPKSTRSRVLPYVLAASLLGAMAAVVSWKALTGVVDVAEPSRTSAKQEIWGDPAHDPHSPGFSTVGLRPLARREGTTVSIVRNDSVRQWHVLVSGLPPTSSESSLQFWAELNSGEFLRLGVLSAKKTGTASSIIDLPKGSSDFAEIWLSLEDTATAERPGDDVLFRGTVD